MDGFNNMKILLLLLLLLLLFPQRICLDDDTPFIL